MTGFDILPLAVALLIGIAAVGSCIGIGLSGMKFLESSARQPEMADTIQTKFFLIAGVTDGAFIIATASGCGLRRRIRYGDSTARAAPRRGLGTARARDVRT